MKHARTQPGPDICDAVQRALQRISRAVDLHSRSLEDACGLTRPQLRVLRELQRADGLSVGELTRAVYLSQATVTGIVDRLERRGLLQRRRSSADRRRVQVFLTEAGRETVADAPPLLQEAFTDRFRRLADWEQTQILSALQRVVAMMEAGPVEVPSPTDPVAARDPT